VWQRNDQAAVSGTEGFQEKISDEPGRGKHGKVICWWSSREHIGQNPSQNQGKFESQTYHWSLRVMIFLLFLNGHFRKNQGETSPVSLYHRQTFKIVITGA
jgi:hypothetical protein